MFRPRLPVVVRLVLCALLAAAAWNECAGKEPNLIIRNLCIDSGFALVVAASYRMGGGVRDLPVFRDPRWNYVVVGAAALAAAAQTMSLPYLADDYILLHDRGEVASFWNATFGVGEHELWFRPIGWMWWKIYDAVSPNDARFAHGLSVFLFTLHCILIIPAFRRLGVPKGVAAAGAVLFAVSPVALETAAWITNQYSLLVGVFGLAAIAALPVWKRGIVAMLPSAIFAACAFLSKEESFLLPAIIIVALAGFRVRNLRKSASRAWPIILTFSIVFIARAWMLGGLGGYRNAATGQSVLVERILSGPFRALATELPSRYFLPLRYIPENAAVRIFLALLPMAILAYGAASALARRTMPRGIVIVIMALAPIAAMLPIAPNLNDARWLYICSTGLSLLVATFLATGPLRGRNAWIPIVLYAVISFAAGQYNYSAWRSAGNAMERGLQLAPPLLQDAAKHSKAMIFGLPSEIDGVQCFNCGRGEALRRASNRLDLQILPDVSQLDGLVGAFGYVDVAKGIAVHLLDETPYATVDRDHPFELDFDKHRELLALARASNAHLDLRGDTGIQFFAGPNDETILLPVIKFPLGAKLKFECAGTRTAADGAVTAPIVYVVYRDEHDLMRRAAIPSGSEFTFPKSCDRAHFDVAVPMGSILRLEKLTVRIGG